MLEATAQGTDCRERCRKVVERLFSLTEEQPQRMAFALAARHREFMPGEPPVCSSRPFERMRELIRQGVEEGTLRPCTPVIGAAVLFGGPLRLIQLRLDGILEQPPADYLDETWPLCWRSLASSADDA